MNTGHTHQHNLQVFEKEYSQLSHNQASTSDYFYMQREIKKEYIRKYGRGGKVLDIGCGNGQALFESRHSIKQGIGVDFSTQALLQAKQTKNRLRTTHISFKLADIENLPKFGQFDLIYSFSTLYYVKDIDHIIRQLAKVINPGGVIVLDLGNKRSLNYIVCKHYPELARLETDNIWEQIKTLEKTGFKIIGWRSFQVLPLWGNRPTWLKPLLHPIWKSIMQTEIRGKMLDEYISSLPLIRSLAFRHIIVAIKN